MYAQLQIYISPHREMTTGSWGASLGFVRVFSILRTTSIPSTTLPKTTCLLSRKGVGTVVMKTRGTLEILVWGAGGTEPRGVSPGGKKPNHVKGCLHWEPLVLGPAFYGRSISHSRKGLLRKPRGTYCHRKKSRFRMLVGEILIIKFTQPINTGWTSAISILEISTLAHEIFDLRNVLELDWQKEEGMRTIQFDETCCLCILEAYRDDSWFLPYKTDGSFQPS